MARFRGINTSAAALAANGVGAWLMGSASGNGKLRRLTFGIMTNSVIVPTSQQVLIGINRVTSAGTTPTPGTVNKLDPNSGAANLSWVTAFSVAPTLGTTDEFQIPFNTLGSADLGWEFLEEQILANSASTGFAFINRGLALPANHQLSIAATWEE